MFRTCKQKGQPDGCPLGLCQIDGLAGFHGCPAVQLGNQLGRCVHIQHGNTCVNGGNVAVCHVGSHSTAAALVDLAQGCDLPDNAGILWQLATLGKVDQGGGGTVAAYMANRNIVTVDAGIPVLSMHAPLELVSKLDCYMTMLACKAIYLA